MIHHRRDSQQVDRITYLEVSQLKFSVPKCLQKGWRILWVQHQVCVMQPLKTSPAHPWLSPPLRQHLFAWLHSLVPRELAQPQTGNCKGANTLEGAHLPVNMGERITECQPPHHVGESPGAHYAELYRGSPAALSPRFPWSWTHSNTTLTFSCPRPAFLTFHPGFLESPARWTTWAWIPHLTVGSLGKPS